MIGAPKCGTSSLHHYLGLHPQVSMTAVKEPQLFAGPEFDRDRLGRYAELLSADSEARGESSAVYSQYPRWPDIPERIHSVQPDARFIYLVGDPVERVVAHYEQRVVNGGEDRSLDEALEDWAEPDSLYVCPSRYATQLGRYLRLFPASRLLVLDQRELLVWREETLAQVFAFLGVDERFRSDAFTERVNTQEDHRVPSRLGRRLRGTGVMEAARSAPLPSPLRRALRRLVSRRTQRPRLGGARRSDLQRALREEVEWLREFTGRSFEGWSI